MEEGESDIENDMGGAKGSDSGSVSAEEKQGRLVDKGGVYKAPKLNPVAFEDAQDRKKRMKEEY